MNVIPAVGPDTAIAPRTGSGSPQTPPQQRADAAPSVLSDSAIQADPGVMLKIIPPVMPREPSLRIGAQLTPDQMAEMLALQKAQQQGAVQGIDNNAEQADLQVAIRIAQAFDALPADVQEAIRGASSPAIAQLLKLAAMTAPGIKEAPAVVRSGPLPLAEQPGEAAAQLLRNINNTEMFTLAQFLRGVMRELSSGVRTSGAHGDADGAGTLLGSARAGSGLPGAGGAILGGLGGVAASASTNASGTAFATLTTTASPFATGSETESASAGITGSATSTTTSPAGPGASGTGPGLGSAAPGAAGPNSAAWIDGTGKPGGNGPSGPGSSGGLAEGALTGPGQSASTLGADPSASRAALAAQAYQGNASGVMLDQLLGLSASPSNVAGPLNVPGPLSQAPSVLPHPGAAVPAQVLVSRDIPAAGLSPQQIEQGVREGLKLLMDGRMVWQGQFTQGVPLRFERSDAWQADRKALGGMRKGTSIRMQLQLPNLGPLEIRALGFGGQVSVRVHAGPGSTETLAGFLPELHARLRQRGLAGAQVVVDAL
ncbi:MAG: flagellar hook-length control protein FliK [Betaproteobacteria bacterium]